METLPLEVVGSVFTFLSHTKDAFHFGRCASRYYTYYKEYELPRRILLTNTSEDAFLDRVREKDPIVLQCDLNQRIRVSKKGNERIYIVPKFVCVLELLSARASLKTVKPFLEQYPLHSYLQNGDVHEVLSLFLYKTIPGREKNANVFNFLLDYLIVHFKPHTHAVYNGDEFNAFQRMRSRNAYLKNFLQTHIMTKIFTLEEEPLFEGFWTVLKKLNRTYNIFNMFVVYSAMRGAIQHSIVRMKICVDSFCKSEKMLKYVIQRALPQLSNLKDPEEAVKRGSFLFSQLSMPPRHEWFSAITQAIYDQNKQEVDLQLRYEWKGNPFLYIFRPRLNNMLCEWSWLFLLKDTRKKKSGTFEFYLHVMEEHGIEIPWLDVLMYPLRNNVEYKCSYDPLPRILEKIGKFSEEDQHEIQALLEDCRDREHAALFRSWLPF